MSGLYSRFSGKNGQAMFTTNVKDEGQGAYLGQGSTLTQFYTSRNSKIHQDSGEGNAQDVRTTQSFIFGPYTGTSISMSSTTETASTDPGAGATYGQYGTATTLIAANGFNAYSDIRLKKDVETLTNQGTENIRVVQYRSIADNSKHFGVIAHELGEIYPELVNGIKDAEAMQSVSYIELIPLSINNIHILKKENRLLLSRIESLEAKFAKLIENL